MVGAAAADVGEAIQVRGEGGAVNIGENTMLLVIVVEISTMCAATTVVTMVEG